MENAALMESLLQSYRRFLVLEEKSQATIEKYLRDVKAFLNRTEETELNKEEILNYRLYLQQAGYAVRSINSMLASLNSFLTFCGKQDCKVHYIKQQKQIFAAEEKELTREEYLRLIHAADKHPQLQLIMQTICSTGIRVSELRFFTVEAVKKQEITVQCKGKNRKVLIPQKLKCLLLKYAQKQSIRSGTIFIAQNGNPLNRSSIWAKMKTLCRKAGVPEQKVFPHNLRKLFARTFYSIEKDIAKLADLLGHSSIDTTRIYIMTTGLEHRRKIEHLGLLI